ncbi:MAG: ATP-binding protein [Polyangiaceae bacterium]
MANVVPFQRVGRGDAAPLLSAPADGHHLVHFYEDEGFLFDAVGRFLGAGLDAGDRLIVIATPEHREGFVRVLQDRHVDRAVAEGQLLLFDAREMLARFMVEGRPDRARFFRVLDDALARATGGRQGARVRAYGEMVDLLWRDGEQTSAIALEELWNEAGRAHSFSLLCAYVMANFYKGGDGASFVDVCRAHSHVLPAESVANISMPPEADVEISRLQDRVRALELELKQRREVEKALRESASEQRHAARERLLASEARFHHLVDAVTDYAIFMLDPTGHVATWNPGAKRTKGYDAEEIIGRHFSAFYTPEDREAGKPDRILEILRRDGRFEDESWRVRKDGTRFWANVVITALRDAKGELIGFAKVTRDLTSRREAEEREHALVREQLARTGAEEERARLLKLLQQVPAIVNLLRGPDLVLEFVHPSTTKTLGGRDLQGKPLLVAIPEFRDQPYYGRLRHVYETGEPFEQHAALVWLEIDGRRVEKYWDSVYLPLRNASGAIDGVMTFDLDVTESVSARRELEQASQAKDDFLATMSHELRTPLNAMLGWATILMSNGSVLRDEAKLVRGLQVIERNARAQERLVGDLLDMSRIISGKLRLMLRRTEISAVIHTAADVVRPAAEARGVRLLVDLDPNIGANAGDPDRLQQVIWNLLTNAVRYTPRDGRITVTGERGPSGISIRVQDTGAGIRPEHLPFVFERFRQIDSSTTRRHGGLGLGLAIVRHLVEAHGGSVEASSEGEGRGAIFTITLPIRALDSGLAYGEVPGDGAGEEGVGSTFPMRSDLLHDLRVLVVDDDSDSLEVLAEALRSVGAKVTAAKSAHEALEASGPFDIIVSDIGMPGMDGYTFIRSIRSRDTDADVPAIALTAYARDVDAERALRAGYQDHFAKPIDARKLVDAVNMWAQTRRAATVG